MFDDRTKELDAMFGFLSSLARLVSEAVVDARAPTQANHDAAAGHVTPEPGPPPTPEAALVCGAHLF